MIKALKIIYFLVISAPLSSHALPKSFSLHLSHGTPLNEQNVNVHSTDLEFSSKLYELPLNIDILWHAGFGNLKSLEESSNTFSTGLGISYDLNQKIKISLLAQLKYLDKFEFNEGDVATKNFGGPFQYYTAFITSFKFTDKWKIGYRLSHMSNGGMYEQNPSLDSHSISLSYSFN